MLMSVRLCVSPVATVLARFGLKRKNGVPCPSHRAFVVSATLSDSTSCQKRERKQKGGRESRREGGKKKGREGMRGVQRSRWRER